MLSQDTAVQSLLQSPSLLGARMSSQPLPSPQQPRAPLYSATHQSGGIRKKATTSSRHRAVSSSYAERLHHLALEQSTAAENGFTSPQQVAQQLNPESGLNWLTPQQSPEPSCFFQEPVQIDQFQWAAPTPPRSDSGLPTLPADVGDESVVPPSSGVSTPETFAFESTTAADMSSLGFLLPQQYANGGYSQDGNNASYSMDSGYPARTQPTTAGAPQYGQTISSSPSFYQSRAVPATQTERRPSDLSAYNSAARRMTGPYDSPAHSEYPVQSQSIPSMSGVSTASPMASPVPGASSMAPHYAGITRSPAMYDSQFYGSAYTSAPAASQMYAPAPSTVYPASYQGGSMDSVSRSSEVRSASQKPKPQCWDHGCNGRQFSTFSNLLRHQREKSGTAQKSYCPKCGAEFTRTTARNGHLAHDKCTKGRRLSEDRGM
ncbi:hypothetical protein AMS68_005804 [Peltaster fructicola]|uniref:C2H2-type domain-containing protein n=1 Tax=Peltaster fructicola TaxID=286661 RepID=A0A6H0XZV7_9PEZI|nr:hypothetical protein AMS68_005804 [Peltaster fructicola]